MNGGKKKLCSVHTRRRIVIIINLRNEYVLPSFMLIHHSIHIKILFSNKIFNESHIVLINYVLRAICISHAHSHTYTRLFPFLLVIFDENNKFIKFRKSIDNIFATYATPSK